MQKSVKEDRDKYIGGSDIPIIMGLSPFKKRFDLLLEKAGLKEDDFEGNAYTEYGNIMEPKIREYINNFLDRNYVEGKHIKGDIRVHTDGEDDESILEIKTTSRVHEKLEDYKIYLVQLLFYMENTKKTKGILAVYERPEYFNERFAAKRYEIHEYRLHIYEINIDDYKDLLEQINKAVDQFRIDLTKVKENPFITEEELIPVDLTKLSNKVVELEAKLAKMKSIESEAKEFKAKLKKAMEENGVKQWETPNGVKISLVADTPDKTTTTKELDEEKFRSENAELIERYELKQAEYLKDKEIITKGKAGYVKITLPKKEKENEQ